MVSRTNRLIEHLNVALPRPGGDDASDAQLLERYIASRDVASFAAMIERHGPMVWGVCRRLLAGHQDAEDAFQATFLVLVRKAASVLPRQMLGNWLHGVARQTAIKARAMAHRRSIRECQVNVMPESVTIPPEPWRDVQAVLDDELSRLPQRYRAVVLLCDLEGKTRKEAAQQLGVPIGTIAGWLSRARAMLAKRLTRRGVSLSGVSLATALVQYEASARVPASLGSSTIEIASRFAAGSLAAGAVRASVSLLTEGVLRSMLLSKLKVALAIVLAVGVVGTGITGLAISATAGEEPKPKGTPEPKGGKLIAEPAGPPPDLHQLKQEVDRLRGEVDALKKQVNAAPKGVPAPVEDAEPKLVIHVYPAAELTNDRAKDEPLPRQGDGGALQPNLVQLITNTVCPTSWSILGGQGTIEYFGAGKSLVVNQTETVHLQIEKLLAELIKVKEAQEAGKPQKK
jgi:RNA polymerase sigma factor (sigma-70 family)